MRKNTLLLVPLVLFILLITSSACLLYNDERSLQAQPSSTPSLAQKLAPTLASPSAIRQPAIADRTAVPWDQATLRSTQRVPTSSPLLPDTEPSSILGVNETWRQDEAAIQLSEAEVYAKGILVRFRVTNLGSNTRAVSYSADNFSAVDNLGGEVPVGTSLCGGCMVFAKNCSVQTELLTPGVSTTLRSTCEAGDPSDVFALAIKTTSNHSVVSVVVSAHNILGISGARWRIPVLK